MKFKIKYSAGGRWEGSWVEDETTIGEVGWYLLDRLPGRGERLHYDPETDSVSIEKLDQAGPVRPDPITVLTARLDAMEAEITKLKEARDAERID